MQEHPTFRVSLKALNLKSDQARSRVNLQGNPESKGLVGLCCKNVVNEIQTGNLCRPASLANTC